MIITITILEIFSKINVAVFDIKGTNVMYSKRNVCKPHLLLILRRYFLSSLGPMFLLFRQICPNTQKNSGSVDRRTLNIICDNDFNYTM